MFTDEPYCWDAEDVSRPPAAPQSTPVGALMPSRLVFASSPPTLTQEYGSGSFGCPPVGSGTATDETNRTSPRSSTPSMRWRSGAAALGDRWSASSRRSSHRGTAAAHNVAVDDEHAVASQLMNCTFLHGNHEDDEYDDGTLHELPAPPTAPRAPKKPVSCGRRKPSEPSSAHRVISSGAFLVGLDEASVSQRTAEHLQRLLLEECGPSPVGAENLLNHVSGAFEALAIQPSPASKRLDFDDVDDAACASSSRREATAVRQRHHHHHHQERKSRRRRQRDDEGGDTPGRSTVGSVAFLQKKSQSRSSDEGGDDAPSKKRHDVTPVNPRRRKRRVEAISPLYSCLSVTKLDD